MTPEQRIKREILLLIMDRNDGFRVPCDITEENIDEFYSLATEEDTGIDCEAEFRCSGEPTGIESDQCSRHYECYEVARRLSDGTYVGWTYWYGGGKHGDPGAIDWMPDAYDVQFVEVLEPVKKWFKVECKDAEARQ